MNKKMRSRMRMVPLTVIARAVDALAACWWLRARCAAPANLHGAGEGDGDHD